MRYFYVLAGLIFTVVLAACSDQKLSAFGPAEPIDFSSAGDVTGPRFTVSPGGQPVLSWMERQDKGATLRSAEFRNGEFDAAVTVVDDPLMFVNWADLPSVTALGNGHWIAHWLRYSAEEAYSYDVVVSQSFDDRERWQDGKRLFADNWKIPGCPVNGPSIIADGDFVAVAWFSAADDHPVVRVVMSADGGEQFGPPIDKGRVMKAAAIPWHET